MTTSRNCQWTTLKPKNQPLQVLISSHHLFILPGSFVALELSLTLSLSLAEASQTVDVEDAKHILQNDKLLGDKVEEIVKEWDAQKEEFYQKTGVSPHDELVVVDNDESGEFHDENETDAFDELEQLLLE